MLNYQKWLDDISDSYNAADFDAYQAAFELPVTMITSTANIQVSEAEGLRTGFHALCRMLSGEGITDTIRLASDVRPLGANLIVGRYETHFMRGATRLFDPLQSTTTLRRGPDGRWRACCFALDLANARWPFHTLMISGAQSAFAAA
ncbi:hypothetical protein [Oceanicella sp. SM1341]|uniref:hypothetical protein n=1 Tax=Oceanicella sp. SM1341 TaxID=1548889 RepID=UPI000E476778|nr:hypothetical protein [Oceanicella sp. SM1341]